MKNSFKVIVLIVFLVQKTVKGFLMCKQHHDNSRRIIQAAASNGQTDSVTSGMKVQSYKHNDWNLTYLYKKASPGRENDPPIILVHPVGIGISSWFYKKLMTEFTDNPPLYAPDLIGCGLSHGADRWDPEKVGLFFPLSWVEGVETLLNTVVLPRWRETQQSQQSSFFTRSYYLNSSASSSKGCLVLVQGGLAPVGVMIAQRNPTTVSRLMLTSAPTYKEMITAIAQTELERNYNFLKSPIFGRAAFSILESRQIIKFFSDVFLFAGKCDDDWLDETEREISIEARPPIQAFNAGLLQHRSFQEELKGLPQWTMIVEGSGDKRSKDRLQYGTEMRKCTLRTIDGLNVLPWENPIEVIELMRELIYKDYYRYN